MKTREQSIEARGWRTRSVWECGGPPPLSDGGAGSDKRAIRPDEWSSPCESARELAQSKTWRLWFTLSCVLPSALCLCAHAQYSIDWSTIDGGGGTSSGGVYSVTGTIGQPDTGAMSGGNYTLQGGFWGVVAAVQMTNAPLLSIIRTSTNTVLVSWPDPSTGWTLQQNTNSVSSVNWSNVTAALQDDGTNKSLIVNPQVGNRFYRLWKP